MIYIISDTTAGLPSEVTAKAGIHILPQIVIFNEKPYRDDTELDTQTFLDKLRASAVLPKTAAPPPALYDPILKQLTADGSTVICIHPSAKVSGTIRSATVASQEFPEADIRIVDTQTLAGNLGSMALVAAKMAAKGKTAEEILSRLDDMIARQRTYFLIDTLEYLQKGGRIGGAKALLGELLQVKPILTIRDGQVEPFEQQRTKRRALARLVEIAAEQCPWSLDAHLCVMHVDALNEAENLVTELKSRAGLTDIPIYTLPPAIIVHAGPKALGVAFFTN